MTSAISLSGHVSIVGPRTGDRGARDDGARGQGFAETLADVVGGGAKKSMAQDQVPQERRMWMLETRDGPRLGMPISDKGLVFDPWQAPAAEESADPEIAADPEAPQDGDTEAQTDTTLAEAADPELPVAKGSAPAAAATASILDAGDAPVETAKAGAPADADAPTGKPETTVQPRAATAVEQPAAGRTATEAAPVAMQSATAQAAAVKPEQPARGTRAQATTAPAATAADADKPADTAPPATRATATPQAPGEAVRPVSSATGQPPTPTDADASQAATAKPSGTVPQGAATPQGDALVTDRPGADRSTGPLDAPARQTVGIAAAEPADNQLGARVSVIANNSTPAPVPNAVQVLGPTSAALVSDLAAAPGWRPATQEAALLPGSRPGTQAGIQSLRIQLHPVELGMVTARLTQNGSQMAIEIQVESNDARQRLSSDSEQIIKALKAIGIEVEKVTIQQAPQSAAANAAQQPAGGQRDMGWQQQQTSSESGSRGQGDRGTTGHQGEGTRNGGGEATSDRAGGSVYI
jgi:chemotaxis protein MotD